ncbi:MAG: tyrosine-type recombinase/integrase [Rhizobiaceae bacterium]|nr:tyrosine-type recombinase/integrase [Rhizobiaceae bacterium]MCV0408682.1 tyrosine-type recombinase/integrase [Rhizobiaceae bacterium]
MARTVRDARLETRAARDRLRVGDIVHWRTLVPEQLHLGYRRRSGGTPGRWIVRRYIGQDAAGKGRYLKKTLEAVADDYQDADGMTVLSFADAQRQAYEMADRASAAPRPECDATVRDVLEAYTADRDRRESGRQGRPIRSDATQRLTRYVLGAEGRGIAAAPLAAVRLAALSEADLRRWRAGLPGTLRATTVRRLTNDLRAGLNAGYAARREELDPAVPKIVEFGLRTPPTDDEPSDSAVRDDQILSDAEVGRLIAAARDVDAEDGWEGDLLRMVLVLAATGARFSQVARLRVCDLQAEQQRLMVPASRKGNRRKEQTHSPVPIGQDVIAALLPAVAGRGPDAPLLERWRVRQVEATRWERVERGRWQSASELTRPWRRVRTRAGLPTAIPYALRHSSIVRGIRANLPIRLVAAAHDTSVGIVEKHYSRYIVSGLEAMLRAAVVPLVPPDGAGGNVVPLAPSEPRRAAR